MQFHCPIPQPISIFSIAIRRKSYIPIASHGSRADNCSIAIKPQDYACRQPNNFVEMKRIISFNRINPEAGTRWQLRWYVLGSKRFASRILKVDTPAAS